MSKLKFLTVLGLSSFVIFLLMSTLGHQDDSDIEMDIRPAVVTESYGHPTDKDATLNPIVHLADQSGKFFCTAFVIDRNYAVTAAHCVNVKAKLSPNKLKFLDENHIELCEVEVIGCNTDSDLALIKGDFAKFIQLPVEFYKNGMIVKKPYAACGYPRGTKKLVCTPVTPINNHFFSTRVLGQLKPGYSGGPVIDPESGVVVAVNFAVDDGYSYVNTLEGFLSMFGIEE